MQLSDLLFPSELCEAPIGDFPVGLPCADSRRLSRGDLFFCMEGAKTSGFSYLGEVMAAGASAVVMEKSSAAHAEARLGIPVLRVSDVRAAYARAWSRVCGNPQRSLRLAAVTGTNGKTSVMTYLSEILRESGALVGEIGTVGTFDGARREPSAYTTPPPELLFPLLARMKQNRADYAVMEASSHALSQKRLEPLRFDVGIFTNLTHDHLDYHKTWEAYRDAKASLFSACRSAVLNGDDPAARFMAFAVSGDILYYSRTDKAAEIYLQNLRTEAGRTKGSLVLLGRAYPFSVPLPDGFPLENAALAIGAATLLGLSPEAACRAASHLRAPSGRLEKLPTETDFSVYLDYAHTPDALQKALSALRPLTKRLTVLFGAGGERDREKRPEMGRIAEQIADRVILTSDNSRSEPPEQILREIAAGFLEKTPVQIPNRAEAIAYALSTAQNGEILLLAGKGHEKTITDRDGAHPFDESAIVRELLSNDHISS